MTRQHRSAGAVVVSHDIEQPEVLLLDQVRVNGEHQTVAPKGGLEPGESPLAAASREVSEEAGVHRPMYLGYLGQQQYDYVDHNGTAATKTVDWFLFAADQQAITPRTAEGFTTARWIPLHHAAGVATHPAFVPYLHTASEVIAWRQARPLRYSHVLNDVIWQLSHQLSTLLDLEAGIGLCGSAARGDFVEGWSDIDLIGWGLEPGSEAAQQVARTVAQLADQHRVPIFLKLADANGRDAEGRGGPYDQKLRAVLSRQHAELPVIAGTDAPPRTDPFREPELAEIIEQLHHLASEHLQTQVESEVERANQARRVLAAASSAARMTTSVLDPTASLRLSPVSALLHKRWPGCSLARLLDDYNHFRQHGADDVRTALDLAGRTPKALADLGRRLTEPVARSQDTAP